MEYSTRARFDGTDLHDQAVRPESIEIALDWAEVAAMLGDFREAVSWLEYVEWLSGTLPPELADLRQTWSCAAGLGPS